MVGWIALPAAFGALRWIEHTLPGLPAEAWRTISFFQLVPTSVLTDIALNRAVAVVNIAALALGLVGAGTRWTLGLAAVLSTYVLGLPQNQVKVTTNCHIVWFLALLAVGPSGNLLSLDALVAAVRSADRGRGDPPLASRRALPTFRYVWILFGLIFLMPGLAKLHAAIVDGWAEADRVRAIFWRSWLLISHYQGGGLPHAASVTALPSPLLAIGAWLIIAFEIGFVVAILFRPLRPIVAAAGLAFHAFTRVTMAIPFTMLTPAYVALIDWVAIAHGLRRRFGIGRIRLPWSDARQGRRLTAMARALDVFDVLDPGDAGPPAPPLPAADERRRGRWLHAVGITLVLAQVVVSGARIVALHGEGNVITRDSSRWSRWRWPFDAYPTFSRVQTELDLSVVRLGLADGREVSITPSAYARTYGSASKTWFLFDYAHTHEDPERRRAELGALARAIADHATGVRPADVREIRLYAIRYLLASRRPERVGERLEYRFPVDGSN